MLEPLQVNYNMIKAVMFDAGGVLHVSGKSQSEDLKNELGLTDEQLGKFYSVYLPLLGKGELTEEALWTKLQSDFGIRDVSPNEHLLTRAFENSLEKMPGMYELVDNLKSRGLTVLLLTNVSAQFAEVLERKGHYEPFEFKILSFEVGSWKPEPLIYKHALEKAGVKSEEAVFIDDQEENVLAAEKLGIKGIVFQDAEHLKSSLNELIT